MISIETTSRELDDGTLERRLQAMKLSAEYREIRFVFPDGTTDAKVRRKSTASRSADDALRSCLNGGGANARRRDEIRRQGRAVIEVHLQP